MDREKGSAAERYQASTSHWDMVKDRRGWGGFYESIMAMMIVTAGIVLITASLTFMAAHEDRGRGGGPECREVIRAVLTDRTLAPSDRMLDLRQADKVDWTSLKGGADIGMSVFLTFADSTTGRCTVRICKIRARGIPSASR